MVDAELLGRMKISQDMRNTITAILANPHDKQATGKLKSRFSVKNIEDTQLSSESWFLARVLLAYAAETDHVLDIDMAITKSASYGAAEWVWTPSFKGVRENPRFEKYLEAAGLIDYWDATQWPAWCQRTADGRVECQ
jgi:hypothetical protein